MTITSGELINAALRKCGGILAEGETVSAEMSQDGLMALNVLLDSWSAERLSVFSSQDQQFTWPAGTAVRTLGPTGDFVGNRPVRLEDSTYFKDTSFGISYGIAIITEADYNSIPLKTISTSYPEALYPESTYPDMTITLYPVPDVNLEFHFISVNELVQVDNLVTDMLLPPGYQRALIYNLACELCPEFGIEPPRGTQRIAMTSKRSLKAINSPMDTLTIPLAIPSGRGKFNIYSDGY